MAEGDRPLEDEDAKRADVRAGTPGRFLRLLRYTKAYSGRFSVAFVALVIAGGLGLVYPKVLGGVVDDTFGKQDIASLDRTALILIGVFGVQSIFVFLRHYFMSWVGERVVADLRTGVYDHLLTMPQQYFHKNRTGELLSRLGDDISRLQDIVGQDLSMALRNLLTLVGGVAILLYFNPVLTGVMLSVVPPLIIAVILWGRFLRRISREASDELAKATGGLQEGIGAIETVQAFTREPHEGRRYGAAIERVFQLFVRRIRARALFMAVSTFLAFVTIAGIFWLGGRMVAAGTITTGQLTEFFLYTVAVAGSVASLAGLAGRYNQAVGSTARIFEILDQEPDIVDSDDAKSLTSPVGAIAFEGVRFGYEDRDVPVIDGLDLTIEPGQTVAMVGPSGSGKTTIGRLVLRFWDPEEGKVTLDGQDLRDLKLRDLRGCMAVVSQDPVLFSGTVEENIRYGRLDASDEEVRVAAKAANAHDFIEEFPEGYGTVVGERGIKLSGGQRQRVSIARAILADPTVLILDEATSALDSESEHLVQAALEKLQSGRTTLVIAHRLSTIRDANRIVVLDHGRMIESGTHLELVQQGGMYARLVEHQALLGEAEAKSVGVGLRSAAEPVAAPA